MYISHNSRALSSASRVPNLEELNKNTHKMSEWVVLDISAITKTTNREKVLKILKSGGMTVCKVTDPYMSATK